MNYGEIKALIQFYAEEDEAEWVADIPSYIEIAERNIWGELIPLDPAQASMVQAGDLVTGTPTVAITAGEPLDIKQVSVSSTTSTDGPWTFLLEKDGSFIREAYPDQSAASNGTPKFFAKTASSADPATMTVTVSPTPDAAYKYEIKYYGIPPSLTAGADGAATWLSDISPDSIIFGALSLGYVALKGEADVLGMYTTAYKNALNILKSTIVGQDKGDSYRTGQARSVGEKA